MASGIIKALFGIGKSQMKTIPWTQMTPELHNQLSSQLGKLMFVVKSQNLKLTKFQQDYLMNQLKHMEEFEKRVLTKTETIKPKGEVRPFMGFKPKIVSKGISDEAATSQINKLRADLPSMNRNELDQLVKDVINRKAYASFDDAQRKELLDAIEYQTTHKPDFSSGVFARVGMKIGGFTKLEVLINILKNTIKGSKDPWVKKHFPNWIKEIQKNPSLANNENVWRELTSHIGKDKAVKNQRLIVHSDDSVDFFTQSEFGPHNIEKTLEFQKKHNLSRDQANKILQMEPDDRVLEMKRLETIADRSKTKHAYGGIAGELHLNRPGYRYGRTAKKKKKKKEYRMPLMFPMWRESANFPYKSLEDIPPEVLEMLRKDPVFDLDTFLNKVAWSDPDKTRIQEKLKGGDEAWGMTDQMGNMLLNYQHFGKAEPIAGGLLTLKSPTDQDKVQTILHEMRHAKMGEPWFWKSKAIPEWVRKYEEAGGEHYLDKDIKDKHKKYRETQKDVSGEELYVRYLDQLHGDVAEKGDIAGSDYKPYFDKILRDHWKPHAEAYREILEAEKSEMAKPIFRKEFKNRKDYPLQSGGIAGQLHLYDGGRARFDKGGMDRRGFLKLLGGLSALPIIGKYFKLAKPAAKAVTPAAEVITRGADGIPNYAWDLINVVKAKGTKEIMEGISKRVPVQKKYTYKGVDVIEDGLGNTSVQKQQTKTGHWYDEATDDSFVDDYVDREVGFEIKQGEIVKGKDGKPIKAGDEYNESTAYMQGDPDGGMDVSDVVEKISDADHLELKKIANESLIKKAEGGRVDLSKGGLAHVLGV